MIYIIVTTCIYNNCDIRKTQYCHGITKIKNIMSDCPNCKIIVVENNGFRNTFLDNLGCEVYYTNNNFLQVREKGYKELKDVIDTINKYDIKDSDFIVKITGRYILEDDSEFINNIKNLDKTNFDCVIKYGNYYNPVNYKTNDCITALIGMKAYFVKKINFPEENECVEWKWAQASYLINDEKICKVDKLGINICPECNAYFLV